ncbi:MAG: 30S ribosomal protein S18 [Patescibacteria group bacterium]
MARGRRPKREEIRKVETNCPFCQGKELPTWRGWTELAGYLSSRSRILGRNRTGICAKHQRRLGDLIKHCRHLGLLPFVTKASR